MIYGNVREKFHVDTIAESQEISSQSSGATHLSLVKDPGVRLLRGLGSINKRVFRFVASATMSASSASSSIGRASDS